MILWFVATAVLSVWFIFRDERFDYRFLVVGALAPDVIDGVTGGAWVMHSVVTTVLVMFMVMILTRRNRDRRKSLLALPIGMFMHLIFDGAFAATRVFWWPVAGLSFGDAQIPVTTRMPLNIVLEVIGLVGLVAVWKMFGLRRRDAREIFLRSGQLSHVENGTAGQC